MVSFVIVSLALSDIVFAESLSSEDDVDFKDRELLDSNLAFKMAITDEDARKIIEGKQLKWLMNPKDD